MRAVIEHHNSKDLPDITVVIVKGKEDLSIKVKQRYIVIGAYAIFCLTIDLRSWRGSCEERCRFIV